jgi:hypothetical protein
MLRSLWQRVKDFVYDTVNAIFYSQPEIDDIIDDFLSNYGTTHTDPSTLPGGASRRRKGVFQHPDDVSDYLDRGGIPAEYVHILKVDLWEDDNVWYHVWVEG